MNNFTLAGNASNVGGEDHFILRMLGEAADTNKPGVQLVGFGFCQTVRRSTCANRVWSRDTI